MPAASPKPIAPPLDLEWVRQPRQARSQKTLERLLDTAEKLIEEKGFDAISVAHITRAARCSVGVFYSRFKDKAELLRCLHERILGEALETARVALDPERWREASAAEVLTALTGFLVRMHVERQRLFLAVALSSRTDSELAARMRFMRAELDRYCAALLEERIDEVTHDDPHLAARFALDVLFDVLHRRALLSGRAGGERDLDDDHLIQELSRMTVNYLGATGA